MGNASALNSKEIAEDVRREGRRRCFPEPPFRAIIFFSDPNVGGGEVVSGRGEIAHRGARLLRPPQALARWAAKKGGRKLHCAWGTPAFSASPLGRVGTRAGPWRPTEERDPQYSPVSGDPLISFAHSTGYAIWRKRDLYAVGFWPNRPARVCFRVGGLAFSWQNRSSLWGFHPFEGRRGDPWIPPGARGPYCGPSL